MTRQYSPRATWLFAGALFFVFFLYYLHLTQYLSFNGGPDEEAHYHAAKFLVEQRRLAVYPDDEDHLWFSSHGTTRSFRPPLTYIKGALSAQVLDRGGVESVVPFRGSSALLGALGVMFVFLATVTFTGSTWLAVFGALCFGLMPQFTFLSSYFNDDVGAVTVVALLLYCVFLLAVRGAGNGLLLLTGLVAGLVILAKPSAWVASVGLMGAAAWLVITRGHGIMRGLSILATGALVTGGWWLAFNMFNHGLHDPLNLGVEAELAAKHRDLAPGTGRSYGEQGFGAVDLLMNSDDFMGKTFKSTIGNLDWLRLEMGRLQYVFYGVLFMLAMVGWLHAFTSRNKHIRALRSIAIILLATVFLQFSFYLWVNLVRDAQPQGRYLLPAIPIVFAMMALGACRVLDMLRGLAPARLVTGDMARLSAVCLLFAVPVYVHLQGFVHYVIPFYDLEYYYGVKSEQYEKWRPDWDSVTDTRDLQLKSHRGALIVDSSGNDPWILLTPEQATPPSGPVMLRVTLESRANDQFSVYWDEGAGLNEALSSRVHYNIGHQTIHMVLDMDDPESVRLDPLTQQGQLTIYEIAFAPITRPPLSIARFVKQLLWPASAA